MSSEFENSKGQNPQESKEDKALKTNGHIPNEHHHQLQEQEKTTVSQTSEREQPVRGDNINVFLRLRPMNKLETSRRSKNCVDLDVQDKSLVTVDSPLQGTFDFRLDRVFGEDATQAEVFNNTLGSVAKDLLDGYNCTVIAYGQTGSGKTHTILGAGTGALGIGTCDSDSRDDDANGDDDGNDSCSATTLSTRSDSGEDNRVDFNDDEHCGGAAEPLEGMVPRVVSAIFSLMEKSSPSFEFTIRCSYVEIYLEKVLDLLNPGNVGGVSLKVVDDTVEAAIESENVGGPSGNSVRIEGASELCCFDKSDIVSLLSRGNACRHASNAQLNTDSSRSHAIFILKIEQRDTVTGMSYTSILHMCDLAGSEMATATSRDQNFTSPSAILEEAKMVNKSLSALNKVVKGKVQEQKNENCATDTSAVIRQSKLTQLLHPSFGGNCKTTVILTASPSSYNIGETISAIRFGIMCQRIENTPVINKEWSSSKFRKKLVQSDRKLKRFQEKSKQKEDELRMLVRLLAAECYSLKREGRKGPISEEKYNGLLWDNIKEILKSKNDEELSIIVRRGGSEQEDAGDPLLDEARLEVTKLSNELRSVKASRDEAENTIGELESLVTVQRTQNECLIAEKKRALEKANAMQNQVKALTHQVAALEETVRQSKFNQNEAIAFLRQFRRFYQRLLQHSAAFGNGNIQVSIQDFFLFIKTRSTWYFKSLSRSFVNPQQIIQKAPGIPQMNDLIDIDTLLLECGYSDEHDGQEYDHEIESSTEAPKRCQNDLGLERESNLQSSGIEMDLLQRELLSVTEQCIELQIALKAKCDAETEQQLLDSCNSSRRRSFQIGKLGNSFNENHMSSSNLNVIDKTEKQILDSTNSKRRSFNFGKLGNSFREEKSSSLNVFDKTMLAEQVSNLRKQLDRKSHDLQAIIWKMNELHMINKTYNEKLANKENHIVNLEKSLLDLQDVHRRLVMEGQESEKKLRTELDNTQNMIHSMTVPLWQFGEQKITGRTLTSRITLPVSGGVHKVDMEWEIPERPVSTRAAESGDDEESAV